MLARASVMRSGAPGTSTPTAPAARHGSPSSPIPRIARSSGSPTSSAYRQPVDIVLRQYPAEYLHELPAAAALLEAARDGQLLWLNDPRAVVAQSKSMLAALWALVGDGQWLTRREAELVRRVVPRTGLGSEAGWLERAR